MNNDFSVFLQNIFDYQRFENQPELEALIEETFSEEEDFSLDDAELDMLNAAGSADTTSVYSRK